MTRVLAFQALVIGCALVLASDIYAHKRVERLGGVNLWGYRGPVARQRQHGEVRIVFVGGSHAFGWGAAASETVPETVRWLIMLQTDLPGQPLRPIVSINLATPGAPASTYAATIERFAYLQPDYVCIYDELGSEDSTRPVSRVQQWSGYTPVLPLVLIEKGMMLQFGSVAAGYGTAPRRHTGTVTAAAGAAIERIGRGLQALDATSPAPRLEPHRESIRRAVQAARAVSAGVLLVAGPAVAPAQRQNLAAVAEMVAGAGSDVTLLDLTSVPGLTSADATLDGYNYNSAGRVRVAEAIAPRFIEWIQRPVGASD